MSYYKTQKMSFLAIENRIKKVGDVGIDQDLLLYELTKDFEIGRTTLMKRLAELERLGIITNTCGILAWKN
jgi:hypothetical protein